jgi:molybdopterin converting factor small subunit
VILRLFAAARVAAGTGSDTFDLPAGTPLAELLEVATSRYGAEFGAVLARSRVWVNGDEPANGPGSQLEPGDEIAVLPPVSGG